MVQARPSKRSTDTLPMEQQIAALEQELARVIDLPTTPADLRARLVERLMKLKARAGIPPDREH